MGVFISKLWRKLFLGSVNFKVIIVGLDNAGKTTTLYKILLGEVVMTTPTIGTNVEEVTYKNTKFIMWDMGGQESLRAKWSTYYVDTQCVIMVIDSTDQGRFSYCREELHKMMSHDHLKTAALLVFANKQDVKHAISASEISERLGLFELKTRPWHVQACCALTGEGIDEGLDWIVSQLKSREE